MCYIGAFYSLANSLRYISFRMGTYYYVRRVPQSAISNSMGFQTIFNGKSTYRVSLKTKDQSTALSKFAAANDEFNRLVAIASDRPLATAAIVRVMPRAPRRAVTPTLVDLIETDISDRTLRPWLRQMAVAENGGIWRDEFNRRRVRREDDAQALADILFDGEHSIDPHMPDVPSIALDYVTEENLDAPVGSDAFAAVSVAVRKGLIQGERAIDRLLVSGQGALTAKPDIAVETSPMMSAIFEDYLATLNRSRTRAEVRGSAKELRLHVGNKHVHELTSADIRSFCEVQGKKVIGTKDPSSVKRPMSAATLKKKVSLIRAAINHAIKRGTYSGDNPASGIDASVFTVPQDRAIMPKKRPLRVPEMNKIFAHPWFVGCFSATDIHSSGSHRLRGMHYWAPIVAAMTGMRASEIGGLKLSEIKLTDAHPHIIVRPNEFRPTKNKEVRYVPIIDALLEIGFADFVENAHLLGSVRLFEDWQAPVRRLNENDEDVEAAWSNGSLMRAFNRTVIPSMLVEDLTPGARREVTFHSYRGAFKTMLGMHRHNLSLNYINEVVGHAKSTLDNSYVGEIPIEETYPAIRACRYEGLVMPPLLPMP